jgi:hypothetical protein
VSTLQRPVWVSLRVLYGPQADVPAYHHGHALDMTQEVSGLLTGWHQGSDGRWYGLCDVSGHR